MVRFSLVYGIAKHSRIINIDTNGYSRVDPGFQVYPGMQRAVLCLFHPWLLPGTWVYSRISRFMSLTALKNVGGTLDISKNIHVLCPFHPWLEPWIYPNNHKPLFFFMICCMVATKPYKKQWFCVVCNEK